MQHRLEPYFKHKQVNHSLVIHGLSIVKQHPTLPQSPSQVPAITQDDFTGLLMPLYILLCSFVKELLLYLTPHLTLTVLLLPSDNS